MPTVLYLDVAELAHALAHDLAPPAVGELRVTLTLALALPLTLTYVANRHDRLGSGS